MSNLTLTANQVAFEIRSFRRNRTGMIFTFVFPIMLLAIFGLSSNGKTTTFQGATIPFVQFFVPGIVAYGVIGACYNNLAMRITILRDSGVLKRLRGTPLPSWVYLAGHIGTSICLGIVLTAITMAFGKAAYGVHIYPHTLLALLVTLIIGSAAFCAMGLAVASMIPNSEGAAGIVNVSIFPILFISDIFYSIDDAPHWLQTIANVFPIKHFANALQVTFDPGTHGAGFSPGHLAVIAVWGVGASIYAARRFRWE